MISWDLFFFYILWFVSLFNQDPHNHWDIWLELDLLEYDLYT